MFDVVWGDPQTESISQRKERKDREDRKSVKSTRSRRSSLQSCNFNDTTAPQIPPLPKGIGFLGRQSSVLARKKSALKINNDDLGKRRLNTKLEIDTVVAKQDSQIDYFNSQSIVVRKPKSRESVGSESTCSIFSGGGQQSTSTESSWGSTVEDISKTHEVQPLSPRSFVVRETEVRISFEKVRSTLDGPLREIHIFSDATSPPSLAHETQPTSPRPTKPPLTLDKYTTTTLRTRRLAVTPTPTPISPSVTSFQTSWKAPDNWGRVYDSCDNSLRELALERERERERERELERELEGERRREREEERRRGGNFEVRRKLSDGSDDGLESGSVEREDDIETSSTAETSEVQNTTLNERVFIDESSTDLQSKIRGMESVPTNLILETLLELEASTGYGLQDRNGFARQLWTLIALRYLLRTSMPPDLQSEADPHWSPGFGRPKVLSLYESKASLSFLAAFSPPSEIHHLSTHPLPSSTTATNFLPSTLTSSTTPTPLTTLLHPPNHFTRITSLTLPTLLPSASLPSLLLSCHRALRTGGSLSLTLLDPCPLPETLGPRLRHWLDERLLWGLEMSGKCTRPVRVVPDWARGVGFRVRRGGGIRIGFPATTNGARKGGSEVVDGGDHFVDGNREEGDVGKELIATIGRALWREIWGGEVVFEEEVGERWWWQEEDILEECLAMGTRWEAWIVECRKV